MITSSLSTKPKATIWGDTSGVHLAAKNNYLGFRQLVEKKFEVVQEIPPTVFRKEFAKLSFWRYHRFPKIIYSMYRKRPVNLRRYLNLVRRSSFWEGMIESDVIIVHGEGLTQKSNNSACCLLSCARIAKELGKESWLVNFSMYDAEPFKDLLREFSYIACRDILTHRHLTSLGIDAELSFDCCVLQHELSEYRSGNGEIAAFRGRRLIDDSVLNDFDRTIKYDAAWEWKTDDSVSHPDLNAYCQQVSKSQFSLSTSFHGNIVSCLSGIPFITFEDGNNKKFQAMKVELLPKEGHDFTLENRDWVAQEDTRKRVYDHYAARYEHLKTRASKNCT